MNKSDKEDFENRWMEAFDSAEIRPSDHVWHKINASLANREAYGYKKRLLFFKLLAAASLVFALGVGFYSVFTNMNNKEADKMLLGEATNDIREDDISNETDSEISQSETLHEEINEHVSLTQKAAIVQNISGLDDDIALIPGDGDNSNEIYFSDIEKIFARKGISDRSKPGVRKDIRYMPDYYNLDKSKVEKQKDPVFWAGVNFSTGVFDPNVEYGTSSRSFSPLGIFKGQADAAEVYASPSSSNKADGTTALAEFGSGYNPPMYEENEYEPDQALAYGISFGYRISQKWSLESGLSYIYNKASTTTNSYYNDPYTASSVPNLYATSYVTQELNTVGYFPEEYTVYSTYEYLSIPLYVGFRLIEGKFNMLLKTGISTDLFLQNTISDNGNGLDDIELKNSEESPFKNYYMNGGFSTQLSYTLFKRYHISVEPGYKFALNAMTQEQSRITSYPSAFMISTGLWYSF